MGPLGHMKTSLQKPRTMRNMANYARNIICDKIVISHLFLTNLKVIQNHDGLRCLQPCQTNPSPKKIYIRDPRVSKGFKMSKTMPKNPQSPETNIDGSQGRKCVFSDFLKILKFLSHIMHLRKTAGPKGQSRLIWMAFVHQKLNIMLHVFGTPDIGYTKFKANVFLNYFPLSSKYFSTTRDSITNYAVTYMTSGKLSDLDYITLLPQKSRLLKSRNLRNPDSPNIEICMGKPDTKSGFHNIVCEIQKQSLDFWTIEWENQTKCPDLTHLNGISGFRKLFYLLIHGISDYCPQPYEPEPESSDLMEFEEVPASSGSSSSITGSQRGRGRGKTTVKRKVSIKARDNKKTNNDASAIKNKKDIKSKSDPFGFIQSELEQHKIKARASPMKLSKSRSNTPSPSRVLSRSKISPDKKDITQRNRVQSSSESVKNGSPIVRRAISEESSPPIDSQDSNKSASQDLENRIRPKASRNLIRTASKDKQSPSRTTRGRSPAVTSSQENKTKEDISEKTASGSQEF
ncbi:unnamed protein product, partial [Meganyctiphanes norvegica]